MIKTLDPQDMTFIKELIRGAPECHCDQAIRNQERPQFKPRRSGGDLNWLFSSDGAPLGICKFDSIARDCLHCGLLDGKLQTTLKTADIANLLAADIRPGIGASTDDNPISIWKKAIESHKEIEKSTAVDAVQHMISDAIVWADDQLKISNRLHDIEFFLEMDDNILNRIRFYGNDPSYDMARAKCVVDRLDNGRYYQFVMEMEVREWDIAVLIEKLNQSPNLLYCDQIMKHYQQQYQVIFPIGRLSVLPDGAVQRKEHAHIKSTRIFSVGERDRDTCYDLGNSFLKNYRFSNGY